MKCQHCAERATYHITEIETDGFQEFHLCPKCAEKHLYKGDEGGAPNLKVATGADLVAATVASQQLRSTAQCPICKLTFDEFRNSGRLGCPNDYEVFREEMRPLLENIHGSLRHIGKAPKRLPADKRAHHQLIQLRQELQQAVAIEDYERAAELRDQIDAIEKKG